MKKSTDLRRGRTCVFMMHVHLVFVTKYRRKVFTKRVLSALKEIFIRVCADFGATLVDRLPTCYVSIKTSEQPQRGLLTTDTQNEISLYNKGIMGK